MRKSSLRTAFTLIELLTVIAITAILMTIIVLPIFQSFNMTRAAQAYSDAQDKARSLIEKIQREFNNGAFVRDNTGLKGSMAILVPTSPGGTYGPSVIETIPYAKVDIVKPAEGEPDPANPGQFTNPDLPIYDAAGNIIGYKVDPSLHSPKGQVVLPVAQSSTIVRYFIGLRDPFSPYNNPYDGFLMARSGGRDNLFVLYRAEVPIYVWSNAQNRYVVNTDFFEPDPADPTGNTALVDDRYFFMAHVDSTGAALAGAADQAKSDRIGRWQHRAVIQTEVSRYDMIQPIYDKASRLVTHDLRGDDSDPNAPLLKDRPRLLSLIQFKPTRVNGEIAEAKMAVRLGEEMENAKETGPDVLLTKMGAWVSTTIRAYPSGWQHDIAGSDMYLIQRLDPTDGHVKIFEYDPASAVADNMSGVPIFDVTIYNNQLALLSANPALPGPFSAAVLPGAVGSQLTRDLFMAFLPDTGLGKIVASFGIDSVKNAGALPVGVAIDQPVVDTGPAQSPLNDSGVGAVYSGAGYQINHCFNRVWNDPTYVGLRPDKIHRFIDLRTTPQLDGAVSPLHPTLGFGRTKIVPGSEVVIGPDQSPGANFGNPVRYTRTTRTPGPNQYKINYVDLPEPDYTLYGLTAPPAVYDPADFTSAVFQARFKVGYVQLNSDPNVPLPAGNFKVYYRFQFTGGMSAGSASAIVAGGAKQDAFAVDYDTRQLMSVQLTIRNYPQSDLPNPQTVTLSATAKVRNYLR